MGKLSGRGRLARNLPHFWPALSITNDMLTHGAGAKLRLATERDLLDAGAAEETVVVEGDTFALSSKRGKRRMSYEDAYVAAPGLDGDPTQGIFSVFDGHGGREAADFASEHLHNEVLKAVRDACAGIPEDEDEAAVDVVKVAMVQGFLMGVPNSSLRPKAQPSHVSSRRTSKRLRL